MKSDFQEKIFVVQLRAVNGTAAVQYVYMDRSAVIQLSESKSEDGSDKDE
jgi:hypothetical protein